MTPDPASVAADLAAQLPGDLGLDACFAALKIHRAVKRGRGCFLTVDQVSAINALMADGEWWTNLAQATPAVRAELERMK